MSDGGTGAAPAPSAGESAARTPGKPRSLWQGAEEIALALILAGLVLLPLAEMVLRSFFHTGISGASSFIEHLTLMIGMFGAALAARENRLLSLSTAGTALKGRLQQVASVYGGAWATAISALLFVGGMRFVSLEREAGKIVAYGIPIWLAQTALPLGFGLIVLRLIRHSAASWRGRIIATASAAVFIAVAIFFPDAPQPLVTGALVALGAATLLGVPIFVTLGGVALILFWSRGIPVHSLSIDHYSMITNPSIATLPLFTLAGYFLAESGAPQRLVRVFRALFGQLPGGSAIVTSLACAFFTAFTGASGVTIVAIGGLLMPVLIAERYTERAALGLVTGAGSLGLLLPPCLPLILYAIVAKQPINDMFLGGIIPSILMIAATSWWGIQRGRSGVPRQQFTWLEARQAVWEAKWELLLPVVTFAGLFGGIATPVEAAAITALAAFFTSCVLHRDLTFSRGVPRVMAETGLVIGGVLTILGVALGLTDYVIDANIVSYAVDWTTRSIHSKFVFLLALNVFLLVVGCLMDIYSAIVIQVPLLIPLGAAFGIDPIHLGIIFLANLELGYLTPPVGLNLYMSSYRFGKPLLEVFRAVLPIVIVMLATVFLITYVPWLTTALPAYMND